MEDTHEVERRFLPANDDWKDEIESWLSLKQGYVATHPNMVRVRAQKPDGGTTSYLLEAKGDRQGLRVREPKVRLAGDQYREFAAICGDRWISKRRGLIQEKYKPIEFHIDLFGLTLKPLVIIESEFPGMTSDQALAFDDFPPWVGEEITDLKEYSNSSLSVHGLPEHFIHWCAERGIDIPAAA